MRFDIIFRSCSRVYAVHGGRRVVDVSKSELILRCLRSLIRSIELVHNQDSSVGMSLTVIDDHSDSTCVEQIQNILSGLTIKTKFISMNERTGNGLSLLTAYEYAKENCHDLIYFVEDDYLHDTQAITEMIDTYIMISTQLQKDIALFPCDYPDLYKKHYPSAVMLSRNRYWRNIGHTTGTMLITKKILLEHWTRYMDLTRYGADPSVCEDNTINQVYRTVPCFSPMPSLTVHLSSPECISPFVNWTSWWEANA